MAHIYLASPHMSAEGYEQEYIREAFATNWIAPLGKNVNEFEKELAAYVGAKDAAALSAGTAAIHLAEAGHYLKTLTSRTVLQHGSNRDFLSFAGLGPPSVCAECCCQRLCRLRQLNPLC